MSNVESTGWVWEHNETVKLVLVALFIYPEQAASFPEILPLFLYFAKVILFITHYLMYRKFNVNNTLTQLRVMSS